MTQKRADLFVIFIIIGLIIFSIVSNLNFIIPVLQNRNPGEVGQDDGTMWQQRLQKIKNDLTGQEVVGYISEANIPGASFTDVDANREYIMTQFFLAPIIVLKGADHPLIIGNLGNSHLENQAEKLFGMKLIHDYGMGIFLFQRTKQ